MPNQEPRFAGKRSRRAQGLVEVCVGVVFLVAIGLAIMDLGVFVMGGDICGGLAKQAARAGANAPDPANAAIAVANIGTQFKPSAMYKNVVLTMVEYDTGNASGICSVVCNVTIVLPVAVPLLGVGPEYQIKVQATEPIVGIAPPPQT